MDLPPYLFWVEWVNKIITPFSWLIILIVILWIPFLRVWWWLFFPLLLLPQVKKLYLWYMNWDFDYANKKWILLELLPPKEILAPFRAMEDVFTTLWPIWDHPNFRELWCDGELDNGPFWLSWEIVSIEGKIHFYVRCLKEHRTAIEMALFTHYPDIEIYEVPDYTTLVPPTIPNEEWDCYGEDWEYRIKKNGRILHALPIKTYEKFFEPQGERITAEEKRLDPLLGLLEGMSKLGPGEHYWVQFITVPVADIDEPQWRKDGQRIIDEIAKRPIKKETTLWDDLKEVFNQIIFGPVKEGDKYKWLEPAKTEGGEREMLLTPGEREIITEVENKMRKMVYRTSIRALYVAKRDCWNSSHRILSRTYVSHFKTNNLNDFGFNTKTRPKVHFFWRKRITFLRARRMFRNAVLRFPGLFPDRSKVCCIMSTEELASMFHFPLRITGMAVPTLTKIESKKAGPPPNLPVE